MNDAARVPSQHQVLESVIDIARRHLDGAHRFDGPPEELLARRLVIDLELDSVQLLTLAMEVENHFQVTLDDVDPLVEPEADGAGQPVETVADLVAAVRDALVRREREEG